MFLTPNQLEELTGYRQAAAQVRWLKRNGVAHYVRADGRPVVPASALTVAHGASEPPRRQPNFAALTPRR